MHRLTLGERETVENRHISDGILCSIRGPQDVRSLPSGVVPTLMEEVRERMISVTLENGGHLASSLGAVELITALLRVFDPEKDRILFDVGHQAYAWKILTGRNAEFDTLRTEGGISGFPKMYEHICDHFGVGHSSTSLSAALGYAAARDFKGEKHSVAAVIGDGAIINGVAFEAMNHAGELDAPVIFILNDNKMSISPRVGGMAMHLARLSASPAYRTAKDVVKAFLNRFCRGGRTYRLLKRGKNAAKRMVSHGNLFVDMGLTYWGPFDGHDEPELERVFALARHYDGPLLIHLVTKKGKGYAPAEENPVAFHGVPPAGAPKGGASWSSCAASIIEGMAERDPFLVALTPAMAEGSGLSGFKAKFPERFFDTGIAEEHMLTLSAGLAAGGLHPVACIYSTFLQRAADQLVHDISLQKLPVIIAVDRAGLVGEDGETHQGLFDLNWAKVIPNLEIWSPFDKCALEAAFDRASAFKGPVMIRYPRGTVREKLLPDAQILPGYVYAGTGSAGCLLSFGSGCTVALDAGSLILSRGRTVDMLFLNRVSPLPEGMLSVLERYENVYVIEENYRSGGLFEQLSALCSSAGMKCRLHSFALPGEFVAQGSVVQQRERYGLTPERIADEYERESC